VTRKLVKNPAEFLVESGLLFQINRFILHPFGLALCLEMPQGEGDSFKATIWDDRGDPLGWIFDEPLLQEGVAKFRKFMADFGLKKLWQRIGHSGGVIVQESSWAHNITPEEFLE